MKMKELLNLHTLMDLHLNLGISLLKKRVGSIDGETDFGFHVIEIQKKG